MPQHLLVKPTLTPYNLTPQCALQTRIPIMRPSWIVESHKVWLRGDDVDVAQSIKDHRLPPFLGVVLCVSGIDEAGRRLEVNRELVAAGGTYVKQITRPVKVTHLICANTSEAETDKVHYANKFNQMGEADIRIVWEDWFWDSLKFGGRFDEVAYLVSNPRPPPRVLPEGARKIVDIRALRVFTRFLIGRYGPSPVLLRPSARPDRSLF